MCGRYYVDDETAREIEKIVRDVDRKLKIEQNRGEIKPSQAAPVIRGSANEHTMAEAMHWGFPRYQGSGLLINARAETITQRRTFRQSVLERRCIIPAKLFYEWDSGKNKIAFRREDSPVLYMAGIYNVYQGEERFVIITTQANASVSGIHNRMPLILDENEIGNWIYDQQATDFLLNKQPVMLQHEKA